MCVNVDKEYPGGPDHTAREAARKMADRSGRRAAIVEHDDRPGPLIPTERDVWRAVGEARSDTEKGWRFMSEVITAPPEWIPNAPPRKCRKRGISPPHCLPRRRELIGVSLGTHACRWTPTDTLGVGATTSHRFSTQYPQRKPARRGRSNPFHGCRFAT